MERTTLSEAWAEGVKHMGYRVLVVDDSSVMRGMIIKTLKLSGLPLEAVEQAGNGKEALDLLERQPMDLALVDLNMPIMSGEELIAAIRESEAHKDLTVVVVSSEGSEARIEKVRGLGVSFIHKPFSPPALRDAVLEAVGVESDAGQAGTGDF